MEKLSTENNQATAFEKKIDSHSKKAIEMIRNFYDLSLNNFEYLRLRKIARDVLVEATEIVKENNQKSELRADYVEENWLEISAYTHDSLEVMHRFFLQEYGIHPQEFPKDEYNTGTAEDFKKYLKILQKRHRDGTDEQSQLTPHDQSL